MTVKERVLEALEQNRGAFFSGAELADKLKVSRNAVWKVIKSLQKDGYNITAITNKGYSLSEDTDIISAQSITKYLTDATSILSINVTDSVTSTNDVLKELAHKGEREGYVLIANEQTAGKGRRNHRFYSPKGTGLYISILLRPSCDATESLFITTLTGVAIAEAIEAVANKDVKIKWVNDVFVDSKKVCGILTEASLDLESGGMDYAVVGMGINIVAPKGGFPREIADVATAIFDEDEVPSDIRSRLAAEIINHFWNYYLALEQKTFLAEYRRRSCVIGRNIKVIDSKGDFHPGIALDIDDNCGLVVRFEDGTVKTLSSGEVSIRPV